MNYPASTQPTFQAIAPKPYTFADFLRFDEENKISHYNAFWNTLLSAVQAKYPTADIDMDAEKFVVTGIPDLKGLERDYPVRIAPQLTDTVYQIAKALVQECFDVIDQYKADERESAEIAETNYATLSHR